MRPFYTPTFLSNVVVRFALFDDFPIQSERFVVVLECPYLL